MLAARCMASLALCQTLLAKQQVLNYCNRILPLQTSWLCGKLCFKKHLHIHFFNFFRIILAARKCAFKTTGTRYTGVTVSCEKKSNDTSTSVPASTQGSQAIYMVPHHFSKNLPGFLRTDIRGHWWACKCSQKKKSNIWHLPRKPDFKNATIFFQQPFIFKGILVSEVQSFFAYLTILIQIHWSWIIFQLEDSEKMLPSDRSSKTLADRSHPLFSANICAVGTFIETPAPATACVNYKFSALQPHHGSSHGNYPNPPSGLLAIN